MLLDQLEENVGDGIASVDKYGYEIKAGVKMIR